MEHMELPSKINTLAKCARAAGLDVAYERVTATATEHTSEAHAWTLNITTRTSVPVTRAHDVVCRWIQNGSRLRFTGGTHFHPHSEDDKDLATYGDVLLAISKAGRAS